VELQAGGIRVAEYLTRLPPRLFVERKLHDANRVAKRRIEAVSIKPDHPPR